MSNFINKFVTTQQEINNLNGVANIKCLKKIKFEVIDRLAEKVVSKKEYLIVKQRCTYAIFAYA